MIIPQAGVLRHRMDLHVPAAAEDLRLLPGQQGQQLLHVPGLGFGVDHLKSGVIAAGAILQYLEQTLHTQIAHITSLSRIEEERYVRLDKFTVRSLELLSPMQDDGKSLLNVIDHTVTPMGGRMLRRWLVFPLKDEKPINERLDIVEYYYREPEFRQCVDDNA